MIEEPRTLADPTTETLRLTTLIGVIAFGWGVFCVQQLFRGAYSMALIDALAFVAMLVLSWWSKHSTNPRRLELGAHTVLLVSCSAIVGVSMYSGQADAVAAWYLTAAPLFAAYTLGRGEAVFWTVVASLLMLFIYLSPAVITLEYAYVPTAAISLISKLILLLMLLGLAVASRRVTDANVEALAQREQVIRERARELADARDEALAAGQAKDLFLANISHEIRTPLNGVIGMTSVLLDSVRSDDQREMLRMVQRSSTGLLEILNEILDFSKLEASAVTLESIPFDLQDCVEDAVDLFGRAAFEKELDLYVHSESDVPRWIMGDVTRLRQVLLNLIGNAIKFTEHGEVSVRIIGGDGEVGLSVCDTGVGVRDDKHEQIFESFSQGDSSTTREYGGTGLGLAISRRLVEMMGGKIWLESTPGLGSTFHFTIRAAEVEAPVTQERGLKLSGQEVAVLGGQPGSRGVMCALLEGWRLRLVEIEKISEDALDGIKAVVVFEDAFEQVRALSRRPPAVLLVQLPDTAMREAANEAGIEAVVFRPVRKRALRRALNAAIAGEPAIKSGPSFTAFDPTMGARLPARLLLAEDNPVNQRVAVTMLEKLGYDPDVVSDGAEALRALDRRGYDVVFLDLQMPGMDGLEATRHIRASRGDGPPWIVALTASVGTAQREQALQAGMDDFITKPFDVQRLMATIERWAEVHEVAAPITSLDLHEPVSDSDEPSAWEQLREMFAGSPEVLAPLIDEHAVNGASLVEAIRKGAEEEAREAVAIAAHTLKSSAAQFGSDAVAKIARQVEIQATAEGPGFGPVAELCSAWAVAEVRLRSTSDELKRSVLPH